MVVPGLATSAQSATEQWHFKLRAQSRPPLSNLKVHMCVYSSSLGKVVSLSCCFLFVFSREVHEKYEVKNEKNKNKNKNDF